MQALIKTSINLGDTPLGRCTHDSIVWVPDAQEMGL